MSNMKKKQRRILVIDDNQAIHDDFRAILCGTENNNAVLNQTKAELFNDQVYTSQEEFEIDSAYQGQEGLKKITEAQRQQDPYIMVFVDVRMPPGWDGIETIQKIWEKHPQLQIIICTAHSDYSWHNMIKQLGQTDRLLILKKPFDSIEVRQIACSLAKKWDLLYNLEQVVKQRTLQIAHARDATVFALASLAESRDPETGKHLERMRDYCQIIAEQLAVDSPYKDQIDRKFLENLQRACPLHDIGKVGIPDKILLKPGNLTDTEFEIMKQHTAIGAEALKKTSELTNAGGFLDMAADIAKYHHERFDGEGYPDRLKGQHIPLSARIVTLADVYDALTNSRVYKPAFKSEVAKGIIEEERQKYFDPVIVDAYMSRCEDFVKVLGKIEEKSKQLVSSTA